MLYRPGFNYQRVEDQVLNRNFDAVARQFDQVAHTFQGFPVLDVRDFGARGDGAHDDTLAIKDALDLVPSKRVFLPEGTYRLTPQGGGNCLYMNADNILCGAGIGKTILTVDPTNVNGTPLVLHHRVIVENLSIVGPNSAGLAAGIGAGGTNDFTVRNCLIEKCAASGINIGANCSRGKIHDCSIRLNWGQGIQSDWNDYCIFEQNHIYTNAYNGISCAGKYNLCRGNIIWDTGGIGSGAWDIHGILTGANETIGDAIGNIFTDNIIFSNKGYGIYVGLTGTGAGDFKHNIISNNFCYFNGPGGTTSGILFGKEGTPTGYIKNNIVSGNVCSKNTGAGIELAGRTLDLLISGNFCCENTLYGIYCHTGCDRANLNGNTCKGNAYGIYVHSTAENVLLQNNDVYGNTSGQIIDLGAATVYGRMGNNTIGVGTSTPTTGTWSRGDRVWKTDPSANGPMGTVCITSGTFSSATDNTGYTDGATGCIYGMTDTSDFNVGDYVNVDKGFPTTGPYRILSKTSADITVDANSNSVQTGVTVSTPDPVFKNMPNLAA